MNESELHIKELMNSFFTKMNLWEIYCKKVDENDTLSPEVQNSKQILKATDIVNEFLTLKERKRGLPNCISYGHTGSYKYNPNEEKIISIEIEENKTTVLTERKKPTESSNKYILKKIKGKWLIDSKKRYSQWKKKWENAIL